MASPAGFCSLAEFSRICAEAIAEAHRNTTRAEWVVAARLRAQARETHRDYEGSGNCYPAHVRRIAQPNDFSVLLLSAPSGSAAASVTGDVPR